MSHSNIIKIKTLLHKNDPFTFEPININCYDENGFLDGYRDNVNTVDDEEATDVYDHLETYSVFTKDDSENSIRRSLVYKSDVEAWIADYKIRIEQAVNKTFTNSDEISTYKLESIINPSDGFYVEDSCGSYYSLPQFILSLYNIMTYEKVDTLYCVYEGVLDYHC